LKPTPTPETDGEKPKETPKEEKPKNEIPKETPNPKETPKETPKPDNKPKETPKEVDKSKENPKSNDKPKEEEKSKETPKVVTEENKKQASKNTLPNTGTESNSILAILGMIFFMLGNKLKRNKN